MLKQYKNVIIIMICLLVAVVVGSFAWFRSGIDRSVDIVLLNDISQTAKDNWNDLEALNGMFDQDFVIFDSEGVFKYASKNARSISYEEAARRGLIQSPVLRGKTYLGTVYIVDDKENQLNRKIIGAIFIISVMVGLFILFMIIYGMYVNSRIIIPFKKMEDFAESVASGNLETPLTMDQNNIFGIFTESFDIMREEIAASKKRENDLKIKEKEMIASLSHDLKTPVTSIKLTCELLMVKEKDEYVREKINGINEKAISIDSLVNDLLVSSLEDLGEIKVSCADQESNVLYDIVKKTDDKNLVIQGAVPQCIINIDVRRMEQIISNIISNSYKYAGTKIAVDYSIIDGYVRMIISDQGPGVDGDKIHLVTNKFFRGEAGNENKADGSGLGLYISKSLIEKMNGEIMCSNGNPGFVVTLLIPLS